MRKALGKFDENKFKKLKGYLFGTYGIGTVLGYITGLGKPLLIFSGVLWHSFTGFPLTLAQFPDTPQFRTAGWFCVAVGVTLLLLQLLLFHGECTWQYSRVSLNKFHKKLPAVKIQREQGCKDAFVSYIKQLWCV